ncbi:MAG: 1-acyl-sn-glycerol-3-phosphate acyltransferase, partial [Myxococcota bacterium]|nr:1-acyl-sn-glycerol-3-phosphate acyltransferase [Myxococcota bacterium]
MRVQHKQQVRGEVTARVVADVVQRGESHVVDVLGDTLYHERQRLSRNRYAGEELDIPYWKAVARRVPQASTSAQVDMLRDVVGRFVDEVMGHFDPRVYDIATRVMPPGLAVLLNSLSPKQALKAPKGSLNLRENVIIAGESEAARRLSRLGTVIVVPTHLSNLDSIVMGYAAYLMGLPPLLYGAGLNLFNNKLIGYFMSRLGAYRVDRRKKAALYKDILKQFATYSLEIGYHNLFFPGGTRIRSGGVERSLKKGLLGTGLAAYQNNLASGREKPNVYYLPCTISYGLVLEAQTLIEDHLKAAGRSRYIIIDDEFSRPRKIAEFALELLRLKSRIYITFGQPLDPFGNRVDFQGRSVDPRGRPIDIRGYICRDGELVDDLQRDREYTSELARSIVHSYECDNRLQSTHLVAFTVFHMMERTYPTYDLYRLLRDAASLSSFTEAQVLVTLERVLERVRRMAENRKIRLDPRLDGRDAKAVLDHGLKYFGSYHHQPAVAREGKRIVIHDAELTYYYRNRADGYDIEQVIGE